MAEQKKVKVFSTTTCPYCTMVKSYLDENKIKYTDANVGEDAEAAQEMINKSNEMGVPQLWIGEDVIIGYDVMKINELLGLK